MDKPVTTRDERVADKEFEQLCGRISGFDLDIVRKYVEVVRKSAFEAGCKWERTMNAKAN